MRPELFTIPFINLSIKSYGFMMVLGFIAALFLAKWRAKKLGISAKHITDFSIMILLAGVVGARLMYVLHRWSYFAEHPKEIISVSSGGLEFLGGFILAAIVATIYFIKHKLPALKMLDILAPAVMLGLAFGRIGCFLNGCCFGAPCELPWAVRFPVVNEHHTTGCDNNSYHSYSHPYYYQITPDTYRHEGEPPLIELPGEYHGYTDGQGHWVDSLGEVPASDAARYYYTLKPADQLTDQQQEALREPPYHMHPIHPTQLYSSLNALLICGVLTWLFRWRKFDGQIFALMMIFYGATRFLIEGLRTDSPLEFDGLTISQNLGLLSILAGIVLLVWRWKRACSASSEKAGK